MKNFCFFLLAAVSIFAETPIVTPQKYLQYKIDRGDIELKKFPETIIVCYQKASADHLRKKYCLIPQPKLKKDFYTTPDLSIGVIGPLVGSPVLALRMEEMIAMGAKRFIAIGVAGELMHTHNIGDRIFCDATLCEDGVAHLYVQPEEKWAYPTKELSQKWKEFEKMVGAEPFVPAKAWSFSAMFKETVENVRRVQKLGCSVVEMEAATLYAIGQEKGVDALSLFIVSDSLSKEEWHPKVRDEKVYSRLFELAEMAYTFGQQQTPKQND